MKTIPTIDEFKNAQEVVAKFEKRQKDLDHVKKELAYRLKDFQQVKFDVDNKKNSIVFAGVNSEGKLKLGTSYCSIVDIFDINIGKLIAVKKALGEDISSVVELVESKPIINNLGGVITDGLYKSLYKRLYF